MRHVDTGRRTGHFHEVKPDHGIRRWMWKWMWMSGGPGS
ncbi:hypothetical protein M5D96_005592 [Drosophila gunungcola]|uniref:Uncharacterized protein n=1 Tax=Drosophila gunungcola TaxID=103775 RepID=A0A9P9YQJ8_9MUSC|nr:hypothetical protein M5D96_005592 [Drosophila gunungcola]